MLLLTFFTADSFIKCCSYEVFTNIVWSQFLLRETATVADQGGVSGLRPGSSHPPFKYPKSQNIYVSHPPPH